MLIAASQTDRPLTSGTSPEALRSIAIRPMVPADRALQKTFFSELSATSRFYRFMGAVSEVPEAVLHALSDVDGANHAAFVAEPEPHRGMIAESRLVRQTNEPERAEFAISVAEQWHRRGLAMTMMRLLETKAAQLGVTVLYGVALPDNTAMRTLAGRLGYSTRPNTNDPRTVLLTKDLRRTERLH